MLILKAQIGILFQVLLFAALLFIPACTFEWPRAIQFLVTYWIVVSIASVFLAVLNPSGLEARLEAPVSQKQPIADHIATAILTVAMLGWFVFAPIDVFHLHLFMPPPTSIAVLGAVVGSLGLLMILATIYQNQFVVPVVRDQSERGHVLVDTGLYARIRHPMYTGFLLWFAGIGLWLESYASVLTLFFVAGSFVPRILIEEKVLKASLPDYIEYSAKVRYRLVPYVW